MKSEIKKPWGTFEILEEGTKHSVKKITVVPGGKLSLQSHRHRTEHWIIAQGEADIIIDEKIYKLKENQNIFIPQGAKHRLMNNTDEKLIVIEMWYGDILEENDIIRFEDIYGRK